MHLIDFLLSFVRRDERGQSTVEYLGWAVVLILVIVGVVLALITGLAEDVMQWIRDQLGI